MEPSAAYCGRKPPTRRRDSLWKPLFPVAATLWRAASSAGLLLALAHMGTGCGGRSNDARVFDETQLGPQGFDNRDYALRLTIFEFAESVGGFVEWFELDGDVNTMVSPYFVPAHCAYFGQGPVDDEEFRIDTLGPDGARLLLQVSRETRTSLQARVAAPGGAFDTIPSTPVAFLDADREPARACRER